MSMDAPSFVVDERSVLPSLIGVKRATTSRRTNHKSDTAGAISLFDQDKSSARIPVSLITGFLGSGKATLLNRVLGDSRIARSLVLVNEFGEVGLDHLFMEALSGDVILLQSGARSIPPARAIAFANGLMPKPTTIITITSITSITSITTALAMTPISARSA